MTMILISRSLQAGLLFSQHRTMYITPNMNEWRTGWMQKGFLKGCDKTNMIISEYLKFRSVVFLAFYSFEMQLALFNAYLPEWTTYLLNLLMPQQFEIFIKRFFGMMIFNIFEHNAKTSVIRLLPYFFLWRNLDWTSWNTFFLILI